MLDKQLLQTRLSIIMRREGLNFLNSFTEYQLHLKRYFKEEYSLDEIETALYKMEEKIIDQQAEFGQEGVIEIPEDF